MKLLVRHTLPAHGWDINILGIQKYQPCPSAMRFGRIASKQLWPNSKRPPLLLIAASEDRTSTSSMVKPMYRKHSLAPSRDVHAFPNCSHWLIAEPGWEEVADKALKWAEVNAPRRTMPLVTSNCDPSHWGTASCL